MRHWIVVYGLVVSLGSMGAVLLMSRMMRTMRREMGVMHQMLMTTVFAASNMWDTLTPEQIRSLHRNTVEIGNGVPPWSELQEAFDQMSFQMKVERTDG
jgi:hypothetical protein